jgi:hypothetical protein
MIKSGIDEDHGQAGRFSRALMRGTS